MILSTDYLTPVELTGFARAALEDLEENRFTLSRWFPSRQVDDLDYRFNAGGGGLVEAATYRAYDAESPLGSRRGTTRVSGELPPISRKIRLSEYDRLRKRANPNDAIVNAIYDDARNMTRSVAARVELARGEALVKGKIELAENGLVATVDFVRNPALTVSAGIPWTTYASATILADLEAWVQAVVDASGVIPKALLTSRRVVGLMLQNQDIRQILGSVLGTPSSVSREQLNGVLADRDLPLIYTYDAQIKTETGTVRPIPNDKVILLPEPDSDEVDQLGATLWGTTSESLEPNYDLTGDEPGIVAGSYSDPDPVAQWTKAAGIVIPILAQADTTLSADVAA